MKKIFFFAIAMAYAQEPQQKGGVQITIPPPDPATAQRLVTPEPMPKLKPRLSKDGRKGTVEVPNGDGGNVTIEYERAIGTEPSVSVTSQIAADGDFAFGYSYTVMNGKGAKQNIISVSFLRSISGDTAYDGEPPGWGSRETRLSWTDDSYAGIAPGGQAGPFKLKSKFGPGLISLFMMARSAPTVLPEYGLANGAHAELYGEGGPLSPANRYNTVLTLGPMVYLDSFDSLLGQIFEASKHEEFSSIRNELEAMKAVIAKREMTREILYSTLANLKIPKGPHEDFQRQFVEAMLMNLNWQAFAKPKQ